MPENQIPKPRRPLLPISLRTCVDQLKMLIRKPNLDLVCQSVSWVLISHVPLPWVPVAGASALVELPPWRGTENIWPEIVSSDFSIRRRFNRDAMDCRHRLKTSAPVADLGWIHIPLRAAYCFCECPLRREMTNSGLYWRHSILLRDRLVVA